MLSQIFDSHVGSATAGAGTASVLLLKYVIASEAIEIGIATVALAIRKLYELVGPTFRHCVLSSQLHPFKDKFRNCRTNIPSLRAFESTTSIQR
jgi:hypothetical protein